MEPLTLSVTTQDGQEQTLVLPIHLPHPLVLMGIIEAGLERADAPAMRMALVGVCLSGPHKPPHRKTGQSHLLYGHAVYDHLIRLGFDGLRLYKYASEFQAWVAGEVLPTPPTQDEVDTAGGS